MYNLQKSWFASKERLQFELQICCDNLCAKKLEEKHKQEIRWPKRMSRKTLRNLNLRNQYYTKMIYTGSVDDGGLCILLLKQT